MAEDRERGGEDLFEDLDKYFAPIDEVAWPEDPAPPNEVAEPEEVIDLREGPAPPEEIIDLRDQPSPPEPAAYEAVFARRPDGSAGEAAGAGSAAEDVAIGASDTTDRGGDPGGEPADRGEAVGASEPVGDPTTEMTGDDWARLREVLGEDDDEIDLPGAPPAPSAGSPFSSEDRGGETLTDDERSMWGPEEGDDEPVHELTLDDLKKAPLEYEGLPLEDPPLSAAEAAEVFVEAEVPLSRAEAAADHFAENIREDEAAEEEYGPSTPGQPSFAEEGGVPARGAWEDDILLDTGRAPDPEETAALGGEALEGPAWEEPASGSIPAGDFAAPGLTDRNLPAALVTAAALIAAALISIAISRAAFAVVAGVIILLAQAELYATMQRRGYQPATALGLVVGAMLLAAAYLRGEESMLLFIVLGTVLSFFWYMVAPPKARAGAVRNIAATIFGLVYVPFFAGYALVMLSLNSGRALVLSVLGITFLYDVAAFSVGSFYGRRPLAPSISPKKSWEGLLGGTVVAVAVGFVAFDSVLGSSARAVAMALVVVVFAPLGDLAESLLKRDLRVKDMGTLLPGHGGVLDRIDSALFVAPAAFYLLRLLFK